MTGRPVGGGYVRRLALAACPRADRAWLAALLAELGAIEGFWPRLLWLGGAGQIVAAANLGRVVGLVDRHFYPTFIAAFAGAVSSAYLVRSGSEALGTDDDVFIGLAVVFGVAVAALAVMSLVASRWPRQGV
jgi:hypothetical protein